MHSVRCSFGRITLVAIVVGVLSTIVAFECEGAWLEVGEASDASSPEAASPAAVRGNEDTTKVYFLDEITISATRYVRDLFAVSRSVSVASSSEIDRENQVSILDVLDDRIGVWVEKRTGTTSDPVVRGLSGGNLLAMMDGGSVTTFWGEGGFAGDDMYGKIDSESIERIEVVRGPSSVLYGSNALGGVVNFTTKSVPIDYASNDFRYGGRLKTSYGSAANSRLLRLEQWSAVGRLRYVAGLSVRRLDDVRIGGDGGEIVPSGGEDTNFDLHTDLDLGRGRQLSLRGQLVHRPKVYRSYRPNQVNRNERRAVSLEYKSPSAVPIADNVTFRAHYQYKEDERKWLDTEKVGTAKWKSLSFDVQSLMSTGAKNLMSWGLQYRADVAESADDEQFTITTPETGEQKASPDTYWGNVGAYIMDELEFKNRLVMTGSVRLDQFHFSAEDNDFYTIPGSTAPENVATRDPRDHDKISVTGGLGLVYKASSHWNVVSSWNRGYRLFAPNFGLRQVGYGLLGPNSLLEPVVGDTYELSLRCLHSVGALSLTAYYTDFHNFQHPEPGSYEGETSYDFDGNGTVDPDESVFIVQANGDAYVEGVELEGEVDLGWIAAPLRSLTFGGGFMWNYGKLKYPEKEEEPLRHTHPARGITKLRWTDPNAESGRWLEFSADMVGKFDEVSESRLNGDVGFRVDPQDPSSPLVRDYGLPGYSVFDIRGGMNLLSHVRLVLALENVLDKRYRTAHSRMDAVGRNLQAGLEVII